MLNKKGSFRTLFPREEYLFIVTRLIAVVVMIPWVLFNPYPDMININAILLILLAIAIHLSIFTTRPRWLKLTQQDLYKITFGFDIAIVSLLVHYTGGLYSNFYLLYYLVIGFSAYNLGLQGGVTVAFACSSLYLLMNYYQISEQIVLDLTLRLVIAWVYAFAIGVFSKHIKHSSNKLLNLLDILNERTTELERTQIQLETIYETSRSLGEIHNLSEVFVEINNIADRILGYPMSSILLLSENRGYLELIATVENGAKKIFKNPQKRELSGLYARVIDSGRTERVADLSGSNNHVAIMERTKSAMIVPMIARSKIIGILSAESSKVAAFNDRDEKLYSILAASAGMAIDNARMHKHISDLTVIDDLTGIFNYRYFVQKLEEEKRRATRYNLPLSLVMLDLDWFKKTNDSYGHEIGNIVLKEIVQVVKGCIRDTDTFCRYGGEEFIIILPLTSADEAQVLAERIRSQVEKHDFGVATGVPGLKITVSLGTTSYPENGLSPVELVQTVDTALYRAKGSGKNMVCSV
jgi:diguanylate cyclase (GGDEF)-like protein